MCNPWEKVTLDDYENHMKSENIYQLQRLNEIMKSQLNQYHTPTVAILGVAGGNGLEHISSKNNIVYGIDINNDYLVACKNRYSHLGNRLILQKLDISDMKNDLPKVDMIIADLIIEYIGIINFIHQISKNHPQYVSTVLQQNSDTGFVSESPYMATFDEISKIHTDISRVQLVDAMLKIGYDIILFEEYFLPNYKKFIRLDFKYNLL